MYYSSLCDSICTGTRLFGFRLLGLRQASTTNNESIPGAASKFVGRNYNPFSRPCACVVTVVSASLTAHPPHTHTHTMWSSTILQLPKPDMLRNCCASFWPLGWLVYIHCVELSVSLWNPHRAYDVASLLLVLIEVKWLSNKWPLM